MDNRNDESVLVNLARFDLTTLGLFAAVAKAGSISAGARESNIALAAASKRISDLEDALKARLLNRFAFGIELTEAGEICLTHANVMLQEVTRMQHAVLDRRSGVVGTIRIAISPSALVQLSKADLDRFNAMHPGIRVELNELTSGHVLQSVADRKVDIGIFVDGASVETGRSSALATFPFREDELVALMRFDCPLSNVGTLCFEDLLQEVHVTLDDDTALTMLLRRQLAATKKDGQFRYRARSFESMARIVELSGAVAVVPGAMARQAVVGRELVMRPLSDDWATWHTHIATAEFKSLTSPVRSMVQVLARTL